MTKRIFPDSTFSLYEYDAAKNALSKMSVMKDQFTTISSRDYHYNAASMLTATVSQVSGVQNKIFFTYANSGLRTSMTDTNGVTQWAYAGAAEGAVVSPQRHRGHREEVSILLATTVQFMPNLSMGSSVNSVPPW